MPIPCNPWFADHLLAPLMGLADDDDAVERYRNLNPNDEMAMRAIIREQVKPAYERWDDESGAAAKLALQYMLSFRRDWCTSMIGNALLPFAGPDDPCAFFEWIWRELFGDEDYRLTQRDDFNVVSDIHATNVIVRHSRPP